MIKTRYVILLALALLISTASLQAQGGCTDSPEAPTALLMLVGTVGMFYGSSVLIKMLRRTGNR
jgi:XrtJ-associated TM-motif-TM protein